MKRILFFFILVLLAVVGCNKISETNQQQPSLPLQTKAFSSGGDDEMTADTYAVSAEDISNYLRFKELAAESSDRSFSVSEVIPLGATRDTPALLYLVNYNDGWEVISGDKRTEAVIASSDQGNLDIESAGNGGFVDGVLAWLGGEAAGISALRELSARDAGTWAEDPAVQSNLDFWCRVGGNTISREGDDTDVVDPDTPIIPDPGLGHWEVFSVETEYNVVSETILNTAKWKLAAPYTNSSTLNSSTLVAGKMMYYLYTGWGVTQTSSYYIGAPTVTWGNLSNYYNDYVGYYLSCLDYINEYEFLNDDPYNVYDAYHISYNTQSYNTSSIETTIVNQHRPIPVRACENYGWFYISGEWTFLIDKIRTYDVVTTTTEVWVYDELPGGSYMYEEPLPRITISHSTAKRIAMNWGYPYDSEAGTDGDDIWFTMTDWNIFGNTYQYLRIMYYNFQQTAQ